jgi:streptomycin 6-kinase
VDLSSSELIATRARLAARFGARLEPWWERLPGTLAELAARWELTVGDAVGRGNTSLVVRCRRCVDGRDAILKLIPDAGVARGEARALRTWQATARVPLLWASDDAAGALLLEAITGERTVAQTRTEVAVPEIAELIGALHRAGPPPGVTPLADRLEFLFAHWIARQRDDASIVAAHLRRGRRAARTLARDGGTQVLLHGDLHPANVLDGGAARGLVAIDPRPCLGDAAFDAIDWVFCGADEPASWQSRSRALAAGLDLDADRLWAWCRALAAMLAAGRAARGAPAAVVDSLLGLTP